MILLTHFFLPVLDYIDLWPYLFARDDEFGQLYRF